MRVPALFGPGGLLLTLAAAIDAVKTVFETKTRTCTRTRALDTRIYWHARTRSVFPVTRMQCRPPPMDLMLYYSLYGDAHGPGDDADFWLNVKNHLIPVEAWKKGTYAPVLTFVVTAIGGTDGTEVAVSNFTFIVLKKPKQFYNATSPACTALRNDTESWSHLKGDNETKIEYMADCKICPELSPKECRQSNVCTYSDKKCSSSSSDGTDAVCRHLEYEAGESSKMKIPYAKIVAGECLAGVKEKDLRKWTYSIECRHDGSAVGGNAGAGGNITTASGNTTGTILKKKQNGGNGAGVDITPWGGKTGKTFEKKWKPEWCGKCEEAKPCFTAPGCTDGVMRTTGDYAGCNEAAECDSCYPESSCDRTSTDFCARCKEYAKCFDDPICVDGVMRTTGGFHKCADARKCALCYPESSCGSGGDAGDDVVSSEHCPG